MYYCLQVNFSSGRYFTGNSKDVGSLLPFDAGFEVRDIFVLEFTLAKPLQRITSYVDNFNHI